MAEKENIIYSEDCGEQTLVYEYCVLRYVADVEREEYMNVGLMMMCKRYRWMRTEIKIDEKRLQSFFKKPDLKRLKNQIALFGRTDVPDIESPVEERYRWLAAVKSAIIQTSPTHPGIIRTSSDKTAADIISILDQQFDQLFSRLIL